MESPRHATPRRLPASPWLSDLPTHPGRQRQERVTIGIFIVCPLLPLLFIPVSEPAVPVFCSFLLGVFAVVAILGMKGIEFLNKSGHQYCPECYTEMDIGATRCPGCQFAPAGERTT